MLKLRIKIVNSNKLKKHKKNQGNIKVFLDFFMRM